MNRNHIFFFIALFAAAALTGWKQHAGEPVERTAAEEVATSSRKATEKRELSELQKIRSLRKEKDRWRATIEMARNLPTSEISGWLQEGKFTLRPGFAFTLFEKIAFQRWAEEEPEAFLEWMMGRGITGFKNEVSVLIQANPSIISEILGRKLTTNQRCYFMASLAKADPDLALAELRKILPLHELDATNLSKFTQEMISSRPAEFRKLIEEFPSGWRGLSFERALFEEDFRKDFEAGLTKALAHPMGFEMMMPFFTSRRSDELKEKVIARIADFPEEWREKIANQPVLLAKQLRKGSSLLDVDLAALGFSDEQQGKVIQAGIMSAVIDGPEENLHLLGEYDLPESAKERIFKRLFYDDHGEEAIAAMREALNDAEDLALFEKTMLETGTREKFSAKEVKTPAELQTALEENLISNLPSVTMWWDEEQKADLAEAFATFGEAEKKKIATEAATNESQEFPAQLRSEAIAYLLGNPGAVELKGWSGENLYEANAVTSRHALTLMGSDPVEATAWLASLPETPARLWGKKNLALNWRNYDPGAVEEWLVKQPVQERAEIEAFVDRHR